LFDNSPVNPLEAEGPYAVLGLTRTATWEEVSKAHRTLVAQLHPDRYVGAEDTVREAAEERVRVVNEAYATIRRQRSARS
jgi:curved DNA-binding protein CbpA